MPSARKTVTAMAAHNVSFPAHKIANKEITDVRSCRDDFADKLMANCHGHRNRLLRPVVPFVDVHVCTADTRVVNTHQHIVDTDGGLWNVLQPQAWLGLTLDQCFHLALLMHGQPCPFPNCSYPMTARHLCSINVPRTRFQGGENSIR